MVLFKGVCTPGNALCGLGQGAVWMEHEGGTRPLCATATAMPSPAVSDVCVVLCIFAGMMFRKGCSACLKTASVMMWHIFFNVFHMNVLIRKRLLLKMVLSLQPCLK